MGRPDPNLKEQMLEHLRRHHASMCRHWFENIEPIDLSGGTLKLLVREVVQLKYLQRCCINQFTEAVQAVTDRLLAVRFIGESELVEAQNDQKQPAASTPARGFLSLDDDMLLSPDYSFDTFVIGPGNRLAHAAALGVAQKPGRAYNPFFIHGGVGLGKTHLLQAICQTAMRQSPHLRIFYISCNAFMNQFMDAVQQGQMNEFRHCFRHADMLLIDDIHDLSNRDLTQEEFFHTFNSLYQSGRQIVLSSDAPPSEIPHLEERITSRFNCGLVAPLEKPSFETRMAIVKSKAAIRNLSLPDDVAGYIAAKIDTNVRELEGAINKIQGVAELNQCPVNLELAKAAIGRSSTSRNGPSTPTVQNIIEAITDYYDIKLTDLLSKRRHKSIALPRQVGMWLTRKHTRFSLEEIGVYFGGRDHSTVMHAVRTIEHRRGLESGIDQDLSRLEEQVLAHEGVAQR